MSSLDSIIVVTWLICILGAGMWAGSRASLERFWVNERSTTTALLVFTIVTTQAGGGTIIGITSSSYASGIGFGLVALISTVVGFLVVARLAPWAKRFGDRNRAYTLPEVIGKRYGRQAQLIAGSIILFAYLSLLAGQLVAAGLLINIWTGYSFVLALMLAGGGVVAYTAYAGLRGDIVTDAIHFWAKGLILFGILLPIIMVREPVFAILASLPHSAWSPIRFGGTTYLVAGVVLGGLIPVVSMEMWMRVYAATSEAKARSSFVWSAVAVVPFYVLPIILGLAAIKLLPGIAQPDKVLFKLMLSYLPHGLLGLGVAAMMSVVISTANTMIVVISAVIYRDFLGRKGGVEGQELKRSRLITLTVGLVGGLFAFTIPDIVQLVLNAFFMIAMLAPALVGLTLWKRATSVGAFWSLLLGGIATAVFLPVMPKQAFVPGLVLSVISFVLISKMTAHRPEEDLAM